MARPLTLEDLEMKKRKLEKMFVNRKLKEKIVKQEGEKENSL